MPLGCLILLSFTLVTGIALNLEPKLLFCMCFVVGPGKLFRGGFNVAIRDMLTLSWGNKSWTWSFQSKVGSSILYWPCGPKVLKFWPPLAARETPPNPLFKDSIDPGGCTSMWRGGELSDMISPLSAYDNVAVWFPCYPRSLFVLALPTEAFLSIMAGGTDI